LQLKSGDIEATTVVSSEQTKHDRSPSATPISAAHARRSLFDSITDCKLINQSITIIMPADLSRDNTKGGTQQDPSASTHYPNIGTYNVSNPFCGSKFMLRVCQDRLEAGSANKKMV